MSDKPIIEKPVDVPSFDGTWCKVAVSNCQNVRHVSPSVPPDLVDNAIPPLQLHDASQESHIPSPISIFGLDHNEAHKSQCEVHHSRELSANVPPALIDNGLPMVEFLHNADHSLNDVRKAAKEIKSWR